MKRTTFRMPLGLSMQVLCSLSLLAILTVPTQQSELPLSRIRVVTAATADTSATAAIPHPDRSVPDAKVSPRVENYLSQYRDELNVEMQYCSKTCPNLK